MQRIYHPWTKWEDAKYNFYGGEPVPDELKNPEAYASFLRDILKFETALMIIINTWKYSCEHNLTNEAMNRVAYLGQAAMALTYNVPSHISSSGYNLLSDAEKIAADAKAQEYLDKWIQKHEESNVITEAL